MNQDSFAEIVGTFVGSISEKLEQLKAYIGKKVRYKPSGCYFSENSPVGVILRPEINSYSELMLRVEDGGSSYGKYLANVQLIEPLKPINPTNKLNISLTFNGKEIKEEMFV